MNCLDQIRENFIRIDMALGLIEETYALFTKFNVTIPKEEQEKVDSLRYNFDLMIETVTRPFIDNVLLPIVHCLAIREKCHVTTREDRIIFEKNGGKYYTASQKCL